jgi:hypothetical protein
MENIENAGALLLNLFATVIGYLFSHPFLVAIVLGGYALAFVVYRLVVANRKINEWTKENK